VRQKDDLIRPSGEVHSITPQDHAEEARSAIFTKLQSTPGQQTHDALIRFSKLEGFAIEPAWLIALAKRRAETDACLPAWTPEQVLLFEKDHVLPPAPSHRPRIYVEGESDRLVLERALQVFFPSAADAVILETKREGGGHRYVIDMLESWRAQHKHHSYLPKAAGIVDGDAAKERKEFNSNPDNTKSAKCFKYGNSHSLQGALAAGFKVPATLEALYPYAIWVAGHTEGHLKPRSGSTVFPSHLIDRILVGEISAKDVLDDAWALLVTHDFDGRKKIPVASKLC